MKRRLCLLVLAVAPLSLHAVRPGDSYDKVVSELGKPRGQLEAGAARILKYPGGTVKLKEGIVVEVTGAPAAAPVAPPVQGPGPVTPQAAAPQPVAPTAPPGDAAGLTQELNTAIESVRRIVNQPAPSVPIMPGMNITSFGDAYFHPGATTPDFKTVDVRATQELVYDKYEYVSSHMNPGTAFIGSELEFNAMTKYFYTDRSVPKKKLTEAEMLEINRLYRIIGRCQAELAALKK